MLEIGAIPKDSFYRKLTQVWVALVLFNVALNILPFFEYVSSESVVAERQDDICAADILRARDGRDDCTPSISAGSAAGITSSSSASKLACNVPLAPVSPFGIWNLMGFSPESNPFGSSSDSAPCTDRGPPPLV